LLSRDSTRLLVLSSDDIVFPDICPVCGEPTTANGVIASTVTRLTVRAIPQFYTARRRVAPEKEVRYLRVPVCDRHYYSVNDMARLKGVCVVTGGVTFFLSVLLVVFLVFSWLDRNTVATELYLLSAAVGIIMFSSFYVLGPSALERAISVVNLDLGNQGIVLRIKNEWYRDALVMSNPTTARRALLRRRKSGAE